MGRLQASLGLEPDIGSIQTTPLKSIELEVTRALQRWYSGVAVKQEMRRIDDAERATIESDTPLP